MRWHEILEYKTKAGEEIAIEYFEDVEGDNNRGWQIDKIEASVDGDYAGYIKVSYIPRERFERYYPTVLNFMSQIGGHSVLPSDKRDKHYKELSEEELIKTAKNLAYHSRKYYKIWNRGEGLPETREEAISIIEDIIKNERKLQEAKEQFKKFENFWVDKPVVDFIRVFVKDEDRMDRNTGKTEIKPSEKDYRRQRIGTALYLEMGEWLKKKGMKLYASNLQQPEAEAAWSNLAKMGLVGKEGKRIFLKI